MRKIFIILLSGLSLVVFAQRPTKKVAILETVDKESNVPYPVRLQIRANMTYAINQSEDFEGFDRVDMTQITGEQSFQRTGMVSDDQIKQLGVMTGAQYVLIAEAAIYDEENFIVAAKLLNVETGSVANSAPPVIANRDPEQMQTACYDMARKLTGEYQKQLQREKQQREEEEQRRLAEERARRRLQQQELERQREQEQLEKAQDLLRQSFEDLANAISNNKESQNYYTLVIHNHRNHPYKIIVDKYILGIVNPYKSESYKLSLDMFGQFQAIQTSGYLFSPSVLKGHVPRQQRQATYTMNIQ